MEPQVALSGSTSFTGVWIARALRRAGLPVVGLAGSVRDAYSGLRLERLEAVSAECPVEFGVRAEDGSMARWISAHRPRVWIHHHHFMADYRLPTYDVQAMERESLQPLPEIVDALRRSGCHAVIYTGSLFEPGEGGREASDTGFTPYARSKKTVWDELSKLAAAAGLATYKVVSPNPIGPFENADRLIPDLLNGAREGKPFIVRTPEARSDSLPAESLGEIYAALAKAICAGRLPEKKIHRPSGELISARELVESANGELIVKRLGLKARPVEFGNAPATASVRNPESERVHFSWPAFWDSYATWAKRHF